MCEPFDVTFTGDAAQLVAKAKTEIEAQDGAFTGDTNAGTLNISLPIVGGIQGSYKISGQVITISITQKPQFVPCGMIESKIREALS